MNFETFVKELLAEKTPVFALDNAQRILGSSRGYASLFISRNVKKGKLMLIRKGLYALPESTYAEIATNISVPSYMTMASALYYRSVVDQMPNRIIVFNTKISSRINVKARDGLYDITLVKMLPDKIFGFERERSGNGFAYVALPEKAIIDAMYMPEYCPKTYIDDALTSKKLDTGLLKKYALRMGSKVLLKRLGAAMLRNGLEIGVDASAR
ncbi:MAG: type IV toxin-antitoxin system AbiEi family antitoxin domain-containing protein [Candidatus Micrarchaeia archaeon]